MNLLPVSEKQALVKDYHQKLVVVGSVFVTVLMSIILFSITASYIVTKYEMKILNRDIASTSNANVSGGVTANIEIIKDVNNKLDILSRTSAQDLGYDLSSIFSAIIASSSSKVHLKSFSYSQISLKKGSVKENGFRIVLGGVADDRDSLRNFIKTLESDKRFKSIDLPISNLIESKDINFSVTIMVAKK